MTGLETKMTKEAWCHPRNTTDIRRVALDTRRQRSYIKHMTSDIGRLIQMSDIRQKIKRQHFISQVRHQRSNITQQTSDV